MGEMLEIFLLLQQKRAGVTAGRSLGVTRMGFSLPAVELLMWQLVS